MNIKRIGEKKHWRVNQQMGAVRRGFLREGEEAKLAAVVADLGHLGLGLGLCHVGVEGSVEEGILDLLGGGVEVIKISGGGGGVGNRVGGHAVAAVGLEAPVVAVGVGGDAAVGVLDGARAAGLLVHNVRGLGLIGPSAEEDDVALLAVHEITLAEGSLRDEGGLVRKRPSGHTGGHSEAVRDVTAAIATVRAAIRAVSAADAVDALAVGNLAVNPVLGAGHNLVTAGNAGGEGTDLGDHVAAGVGLLNLEGRGADGDEGESHEDGGEERRNGHVARHCGGNKTQAMK